MRWQDEAVVLSARPPGETAVIAQLLTRGLGRHAGRVRGGHSARLRGVYQSANLVAAPGTGRLPGPPRPLACELARPYPPQVLLDSHPLSRLTPPPAADDAPLPATEPPPAPPPGF